MEPITDRQLYSWGAAAVVGTTVLLLPGHSWVCALFGAAACAAWLALARRRTVEQSLPEALLRVLGRKRGAALLVTQALGLCVVAACLAGWTDTAFFQARGRWFYPAVMLSLAAAVIDHGAAAPARAGAMLGVPALVLAGGILSMAATKVQPAYLMPDVRIGGGFYALAALSLPGCGLYLRRKRCNARLWGWFAACAALAVAASVIGAGVLGPVLAKKQPFALYSITQSLRAFGSMERFEALLSVIAAAALYAGILLTLCVAAQLLSGLMRKKNMALPWALAALSWGLWMVLGTWSRTVFLIAATLFCAVFPLAAQVLVAGKIVRGNCQKGVDKS